MAETRSLYLN